jgi:hypothetical protein
VISWQTATARRWLGNGMGREADFSTAAAKCAAFGRNDGSLEWGEKTNNGNSVRYSSVPLLDYVAPGEIRG